MLLKGKKGIIFGALDERSIAWKVAEKCKDHGAKFILTNDPIALRMGKIDELAHNSNAKIIPADVTVKNPALADVSDELRSNEPPTAGRPESRPSFLA